MSAPEHSPLPWGINLAFGVGANPRIYDAGNSAVAYLPTDPLIINIDQCRANARLIVTAVNAHAGLLAAAKEAWSAYNFGVSSPYKMKPAFEHLKTAIAHAEEPAP